MAVQNNVNSEKMGMDVDAAYIKLAQVIWSDVDQRLRASFTVFGSEQARRDGLETISIITIDVSDLVPDLQAQLYNRLKQTPEFSNANDV